MRARAVGLIVLVLLIAACSARLTLPSDPPGTAESSAQSSPVAPSHTPDAIVPGPSIDPAWLAARAITCDGQLFFSTALLAGPGREETGLDPPAMALRTYLAGSPPEEEADRPSRGWHRVAQMATKVEFVAVSTDGRALKMVSLSFELGTWQIDQSGTCRGEVQRPDGLGRADWWLDPQVPKPQPADRDIHGLLMEMSCASGKSPEGRVQAPVIDYFDNVILVTMSVRHRPGGQDCPGNPNFPFRLHLDQPIGDRRLLDGGVMPPRDAAIAPD